MILIFIYCTVNTVPTYKEHFMIDLNILFRFMYIFRGTVLCTRYCPAKLIQDTFKSSLKNLPVPRLFRFMYIFGGTVLCTRYCPARWIWMKVGSLSSLKALSSEMDPRYIQKFFEKSARPPSCESPLKISYHLTAVGNSETNSQHGNYMIF